MENIKVIFDMPESEFSNKEEMPIAIVDGMVVSHVPLDKFLEDCGFRYDLTIQYEDGLCIDIFEDDENNGAIVEYRPTIVSYELNDRDKISVSGFVISQLEIYSSNSGEMERVDLKKVIGNYPTSDYEKSLSRIIEKLKAEEKNTKYTI